MKATVGVSSERKRPRTPATPGEAPVQRRDLLGLSALCGSLATVGMAIAGILRFIKPAVLPDPREVYRIDNAHQLKIPSVIEVGDGAAFLYRDEEGFYAISAVCPHLGCRVRRTEPGRLSCPCHGSAFDGEGRIAGGPAPRSLPWLRVSWRVDGRLEIDAAQEVPRGWKLKA